MKKLIILILVVAFYTNSYKITAQTPEPPNGKEWVSVDVLTDDFSDFDSSKWQKGHPYWSGRSPSQFNNNNISYNDGKMRLKGSLRNSNRQGDFIWTACLTSKSKSFKKGMYAEARIKNADMAIVSSFWMQGDYSEIDVIENWGEVKNQQWDHLPSTMEMNSHYFIDGWSNDKITPKHYNNSNGVGNSDAYAVYGIWWKNSRNLIWYRDGVEVASVTLDHDFNENMYMFFDMEAFTWGPGVASNNDLNNGNKNLAYYDYVKTYKLEDGDGTNDDDNAPDKITLSDPALEIEAKQSYDFDVAYSTTSTNREVLVSFWKGNTWLAAGTANVNAGQNQTQRVTVNLNNLPDPGNDYVYKYHIRPRGTDFSNATDEGAVFNITVRETLGDNDTNLKIFKMYPSPVSNILHFKSLEANLPIFIYDYTGRKIIETKSAKNNTTINVENIQSGAYFVKISGYKVKRLVVIN